MPIVNTIEISSLADYLETILTEDDTSDNFWFRGESRDYNDSRLTPSIFRGNGYYEKNMFHEFRQRHFETYKHFSNFQWLCLMQHYNLPTRLLDWSTNPLIALYFASIDNSQDGYVYEISPGILNDKTGSPGLYTGESLFVKARVEMVFWSSPTNAVNSETFHSLPLEDKSTLENHLTNYSCYPIALIPEITNARMSVQSCRFTIHGGKHDNKHRPTHTSECVDITVYRIKKTHKRLIIKNLEKLSIHLGSLFPEIDHTASYLRSKYKC